jgi:hypothetical protein
MAYDCVRLAAAGANAAEREAGSTYIWGLSMANAQRWDSGVMLVPLRQFAALKISLAFKFRTDA